MKVKICGISHESEVKTLDSMNVNYCGLWWKISGGKYTLTDDKLHSLLNSSTRNLKKIVVTFEGNVTNFCSILCNDNVYGIQLHGFQLPSVIRKIKEIRSDVKVFKVLHIKGTQCFEETMINRYRESGVDFFILDNFVSASQIGSTGKMLDLDYLYKFSSKLTCSKVFIAGGISVENMPQLARIPNLYGVDIDSSARSSDAISQGNVCEIMSKAAMLDSNGSFQEEATQCV